MLSDCTALFVRLVTSGSAHYCERSVVRGVVKLLGSDIAAVSPDSRNVRHHDVLADRMSGYLCLLLREMHPAN